MLFLVILFYLIKKLQKHLSLDPLFFHKYLLLKKMYKVHIFTINVLITTKQYPWKWKGGCKFNVWGELLDFFSSTSTIISSFEYEKIHIQGTQRDLFIFKKGVQRINMIY